MRSACGALSLHWLSVQKILGDPAIAGRSDCMSETAQTPLLQHCKHAEDLALHKELTRNLWIATHLLIFAPAVLLTTGYAREIYTWKVKLEQIWAGKRSSEGVVQTQKVVRRGLPPLYKKRGELVLLLRVKKAILLPLGYSVTKGIRQELSWYILRYW